MTRFALAGNCGGFGGNRVHKRCRLGLRRLGAQPGQREITESTGDAEQHLTA